MRIFITGITGTLGTALAKLHQSRGDQVFGCARSEPSLVAWLRVNPTLATVYLSDAEIATNNKTDSGRLFPNIQRVYHCAATKHIDLCQSQPNNAYRNNVGVTASIAASCRRMNIPFYFISSDKACMPLGVYGATKLIGEAITLKDNGAVVRLGNLIASSGSVFKLWEQQVREGKNITLTDPAMTRYFIKVDDAAKFVADQGRCGFVSVPYTMKAAMMGDVARVMVSDLYVDKISIIGMREGEGLHQWIVGSDEKVTIDNTVLRFDSNRGKCMIAGMHSTFADRWDTKELLQAAGVTTS